MLLDPIVLADRSNVTTSALYFTKYEFGPIICPRAGCMNVYKGYVFVAWYRGGMKNRHLMLSRTKVGSSDWLHVVFPHQHIGFKGCESIGDSHNTVSMAVCPINDSIHLLFDMHAYRPSQFPNDFFNYIYSIDGAATVNDDLWKMDLFHPKQNYLKKGEDYSRVTYPGFLTTPDGLLIAKYRVGGHTDATMFLNFYDGKNWSAPKKWNNTRKCGIYGGFSIRSDRKMDMVFATRTCADREKGYCMNRGVYYAYSNCADGFDTWFNLEGHKQKAPITNINQLKLFDPAQPGDKYSNPSFAMTNDGSMHFLAPIKRNNQSIAMYFFKRKDDTTFRRSIIETGDLNNVQGLIFTTNNTVFLVSLKKERPMIQSAAAGTDCFRTEYYSDKGPGYRTVVTNLWKDAEGNYHLFLCAMIANGKKDEQAMELLHFLLPDTKNW